MGLKALPLSFHLSGELNSGMVWEGWLGTWTQGTKFGQSQEGTELGTTSQATFDPSHYTLALPGLCPGLKMPAPLPPPSDGVFLCWKWKESGLRICGVWQTWEQLAMVLVGRPMEGAQATSRTQSLCASSFCSSFHWPSSSSLQRKPEQGMQWQAGISTLGGELTFHVLFNENNEWNST